MEVDIVLMVILVHHDVSIILNRITVWFQIHFSFTTFSCLKLPHIVPMSQWKSCYLYDEILGTIKEIWFHFLCIGAEEALGNDTVLGAAICGLLAANDRIRDGFQCLLL